MTDQPEKQLKGQQSRGPPGRPSPNQTRGPPQREALSVAGVPGPAVRACGARETSRMDAAVSRAPLQEVGPSSVFGVWEGQPVFMFNVKKQYFYNSVFVSAEIS